MNQLIKRMLPTILLPALLACCAHGAGSHKVQLIDRPLFDEQRLELTRDYCRLHYGLDSWRLETPRMIVVHYSAFPTLTESLDFFQPVLLSRRDIRSGGAVNVSAHFLVDRDGAIYRLASDEIVCRHVIGFNHLALGIENVGASEADLTESQLESDAALIADLVARHPTISYLVGHHEYQDRTLPHFALQRELDSSYRPTVKTDPGERFMTRLRELLRDRYRLELGR